MRCGAGRSATSRGSGPLSPSTSTSASTRPRSEVLADAPMPGARWFAGATLSYPEHIFRGRDDDAVAIRHASELRPLESMTWGQLRTLTARIQAGLRARGVGPGDRVVAYMPNIPETIAAFLATAGLGAIWSCARRTSARARSSTASRRSSRRYCSPSTATATAGATTTAAGGRGNPCAGRRELVRLGYLDGGGWEDGFLGADADAARARATPVAFDHPLWSCTPADDRPAKAIVQGHGGVLLEQLKHQNLHLDMHEDDRAFWFTTTGWMMWNWIVGVLLTPASIVLYNGSPGAPTLDRLWELAAEAGSRASGRARRSSRAV